MRIQILILEFKGLKKLLKTVKDDINNTANKKGGTDGQTWEGLKLTDCNRDVFENLLVKTLRIENYSQQSLIQELNSDQGIDLKWGKVWKISLNETMLQEKTWSHMEVGLQLILFPCTWDFWETKWSVSLETSLKVFFYYSVTTSFSFSTTVYI